MNTPVYSWEFMRELVSWSRYVALAVALGSGALMGDPRFAITCAAAAGLDIWLFSLFEDYGRSRLSGAAATVAYRRVAALVGVRFAFKGVLLVLAIIFPRLLSFWGMVAGVLIVDTTVLVVGAVVASVRTMSSASAHDGQR